MLRAIPKQKNQAFLRRHDYSELRYSVAFELEGRACEIGTNWLKDRLFISEFTRRGFLTRVPKHRTVNAGDHIVLHASVDLVTQDDEPIHKIFFMTARVLKSEQLSEVETNVEIEVDPEYVAQWRRFRAIFRLRQMRINQILRMARG